MATLESIASIVLLVLMVFLVSAWIGSRAVEREVRRSVHRGEALPRIARWWERIASWASWIAGAAAALLILGGILYAGGRTDAAQALFVAGTAVAGYLMQAFLMARAIRRAAAQPPP